MNATSIVEQVRQALYEAGAGCPARLKWELARKERDIEEDNEERDQLEDEENSDQQRAGGHTWAKDFFDSITNPSHRKCVLPPEPTKNPRAMITVGSSQPVCIPCFQRE